MTQPNSTARTSNDKGSGTALKFSEPQRDVIRLMREKGITYTNDPNIYAPITAEASQHDAYTVWVNYRTARALQRKGVGRIQGVMEECEFVLFPAEEWPL